MRTEDILEYLRAVPFRPFRIIMNSGKAYDVRHPEWIKVGRTSLLYFYTTEPDGAYERYDTVSLLLIPHIEHIDQPAGMPGRGGNGPTPA
jgi:hypothetical protein